MIGTQVSHYRILAEIGSGGMGVVYKAEDTRLGRVVALKFLPPAIARDEQARARFTREARTLSSLQHSNICTLFDVGVTEEGRPFMCMELYEGETLSRKIARGPLKVDETLDIAHQAALGLAAAHTKGIIHRDVTPGNIFLTRDGQVKILDFGVARLTERSGSESTSGRIGTAPYLAPEQIRDGTTSEQSDLFSLGVVLYEALTATRPFKGEFEASLLYSILNVDPPAPGELRKDLPPDLGSIIGKLLRKDPSERYESARTLAADIALLQAGAPRRSAGPGRAAGLFFRRHRVLSGAAAAVIAALAVGELVRAPASSLVLKPAEYVLVADFRNGTADRVFDHSLDEALRVSLRQSPHFNLFSPDRTVDALRRMDLAGNPVLSESLAVTVARREGVRVVLAGEISLLGSRYFLTCRIIDAVSRQAADVVRREAASIEEVLPEMDRLCEDLRGRLGESVEEIERYRMPLERVTTASLEALELYSEGNAYEGLGLYQEAAVLKEQAVRKDSLFTMAVSDLSYIHRKLGNDSLALFYHRRVLPLVDRVTDRERFYILSVYYGPSFEFDYERAFRSIQQLVLRYPNSPEGYATLAHLAMYAGDYESSIAAGRRSLAIDSVYAATVFSNMGFAGALAGDARQAIESYRRSKLLRPEYAATERYLAQAYWELEEYDSVRFHLDSAYTLSDEKGRILVGEQRVCLLSFLGRLSEAEGACREGISLCRVAGRQGEEAYFRYLLSGIYFDRGKNRAAVQELRMVEQLSASPYPELPMAAAMYARHGLVGDADRILRRLGTIACSDPYFTRRRSDYLHFVEAEILLARARWHEALARFEGVTRVHSGDPLYLQALRGAGTCGLRAGQRGGPESLERVLKHRGEVVLGFVLSMRNSGPWIRELWPEVQLQLGRHYATLGERDRATDYLQRCLKAWEQSDEGFAPAEEARRLLDMVREQPPSGASTRRTTS